MTPCRILHVDDEPDIRDVVELSLALDPRFTIRSCASGEDAIAEAADWLPDLILCDVMMPVLDGPATLARLRADPRHVEGSDQVDLNNFLEGVERKRAILGQRLDRVSDTGTVDVDPQRTECFCDIKRLADGGFVGDVGLDELGPITEICHRLIPPEVDHHHLRARVEQSLRSRQAEPGGTASDDGYSVLDLH